MTHYHYPLLAIITINSSYRIDIAAYHSVLLMLSVCVCVCVLCSFSPLLSPLAAPFQFHTAGAFQTIRPHHLASPPSLRKRGKLTFQIDARFQTANKDFMSEREALYKAGCHPPFWSLHLKS
jgi:hypothetical protein